MERPTDAEVRESLQLRGSDSGPHARQPRGRPPRKAIGIRGEAEVYSISRLTTIVYELERRLALLHRFVEQIYDEVGQLRGSFETLARPTTSPGRPGPISLTMLTRQEQRIALLAADGMSNRDMGEELDISAATVRGHMKAVIRKLGIHSRWELAYLLSSGGWVSSSSLQTGARPLESGAQSAVGVLNAGSADM